jgi:two-component system cell cycle response regulator DivK
MANELILIIEDNEKNRKLIRDLLQVKGYQTIESETAEDGLKLAEKKTPALIHGHPTLRHGRHHCDEAPQGGA